jgi:uncharacterized protein YbjT (DUF2867 family)
MCCAIAQHKKRKQEAATKVSETMSNKILVVNSTGTVGRSLVQTLTQSGEAVLAGTRNPRTVEPMAGVQPVRFDYRDPSTFAPALTGVDRVFLLSPTGHLAAHELLLPFVEQATQGGERKIVLMTAAGVEFNDAIPLRQVERAVERSGAPYVLLRPSWFMDNFHTFWLAPIRQDSIIPLPAGEGRTALIDARDIADAAASALQSNRFDGQAFTLTGPEALTYGEAAATLSAAVGREIRYVPTEDAAFIQSLIAAGMAEEYARNLTALFGLVRQGFAAQVTPDVETLTGHAPRTLAHYAQDSE